MFANRLKVLYSKGMVLNVQLKGHVKHVQMSVKELNASELSEEVSKGFLVVKSIDLQLLIRLL